MLALLRDSGLQGRYVVGSPTVLCLSGMMKRVWKPWKQIIGMFPMAFHMAATIWPARVAVCLHRHLSATRSSRLVQTLFLTDPARALERGTGERTVWNERQNIATPIGGGGYDPQDSAERLSGQRRRRLAKGELRQSDRNRVCYRLRRSTSFQPGIQTLHRYVTRKLSGANPGSYG